MSKNIFIKDLKLENLKYIKSYKMINSSYKLSLNETKVLNTLFTLITKKDFDFFTFTLPLTQFSFLYENRNQNRIKKIVDNLSDLKIKIDNDDMYIKYNLFQKIAYYKKDKTIQFKFNYELKEYVLQLKSNFMLYKLHYTLKFKSEYSVRLYEILKQRERIGYYKVQLNELLYILDVPKSYHIYNNFKRKVLEFCKKDLKENADIFFIYDEIKDGKSVSTIHFKISNNLINSLQNKENFIKFIRNNYINIDLYNYNDGFVRVSDKGLIYISNSRQTITKENSLKMWDFLFEKRKDLLIDLSMYY